MIREILEQNGYSISFDWVRGVVIKKVSEAILVDGVCTQMITPVFNFPIINQSNKEVSIEQACRQYVKENGFKLEWFKEYTIEHYKNEDCDLRGLITLYSLYNFNKANTLKLIAWLYANNIEIKE